MVVKGQKVCQGKWWERFHFGFTAGPKFHDWAITGSLWHGGRWESRDSSFCSRDQLLYCLCNCHFNWHERALSDAMSKGDTDWEICLRLTPIGSSVLSLRWLWRATLFCRIRNWITQKWTYVWGKRYGMREVGMSLKVPSDHRLWWCYWEVLKPLGGGIYSYLFMLPGEWAIFCAILVREIVFWTF